MRMLLEFDTEFNHYLIQDTIYGGRMARVLYSGDKIAAMSGVAHDNNPELLFDYNQRFRELIQGIGPKQMLVLGGGALTFPAALLQEFPELGMEVVEIDGTLIKMAEKYFDFRPNKRTRVHIGDGSLFLAKTSNTYDAIIVDVFDNVSIPPAFQTIAFAQNLQKQLNRRGIVAVNVVASLRGRRSKVIRTMHRLLQAEFPIVQIFPATAGLSSWTPQNYVVVGQDGSWDTASFLIRPPVEPL